MEQTTTTDDERRATELHDLLTAAGVPCVVHQDRSHWGVRIWLTSEDGPEYGTPSLFVLTEGQRVASRSEDWQWFGCLAGFGERTDTVLEDVMTSFNEWDGVA